MPYRERSRHEFAKGHPKLVMAHHLPRADLLGPFGAKP
jgi:hypothetical protein